MCSAMEGVFRVLMFRVQGLGCGHREADGQRDGRALREGIQCSELRRTHGHLYMQNKVYAALCYNQIPPWIQPFKFPFRLNPANSSCTELSTPFPEP